MFLYQRSLTFDDDYIFGRTDVAVASNRITVLVAFSTRLTKFPDGPHRYVSVYAAFAGPALGAAKLRRFTVPMANTIGPIACV